MQVWNVLHALHWKYRMQKSRQKSPSGYHHTTLSGYIFATKARIDNWRILVEQQYLLHMSSEYSKLWPTNGWDWLTSLGQPCKFQLVSRLGSVTALHSSSGRQPNFTPLNRGRHLYSAGRPSRWALADISIALLCYSLHFAWVVDDAKCIVVTRVCVSVCPRRMPTLLHGPGCNLGRGIRCPLVVRYWQICNQRTGCIAMAT